MFIKNDAEEAEAREWEGREATGVVERGEGRVEEGREEYDGMDAREGEGGMVRVGGMVLLLDFRQDSCVLLLLSH